MTTQSHFERSLRGLFDVEKLSRFPDEWALNFRGGSDISKIGYCTNLTPDTVDAAILGDVDLILTHHDVWPFLYGMPEVCARKLDEHKISNCFVHLPLDDADFGTNASLASRLGLENIEKSALEAETFYCGRIGEWKNGKTMDEVKAQLEQILGESVRAWQNHERLIRRVCIVTGAGMSTNFKREASERGCDLYITGEKTLYSVEYAEFVGMNLIVGSHTGTELPGVEELAHCVSRTLPDVQVIRLHEDEIE